ncbi:hypothetical protein D1BOALGB6SA_1030 [Olavius sp. associated proteobacterium Delta 1]|nr:hypothetical protein D1BOALGB6SA_1030 [Olavius sp. associated proteobacterium Delta 1]
MAAQLSNTYRSLLVLLGLLGVGLSACSYNARIVHGHLPMTEINVAPSSSQNVQDAARALTSYIRQSTGATIPVVSGGCGTPTCIHLGSSPEVDNFEISLDGLGSDGFVITFPDTNTIVILGPTDWGTEFGAYEFLERYVGVRWLLPGEEGDWVPSKPSLSVPAVEVRQTPAIEGRDMIGFTCGEQQLWARRMRFRPLGEFSHNMKNLFPPAELWPSASDFYCIGGQGEPDEEGIYWQPHFSAPGLVDEAVDRIRGYIAANPELKSYSLGMNDNHYFSGCCPNPILTTVAGLRKA